MPALSKVSFTARRSFVSHTRYSEYTFVEEIPKFSSVSLIYRKYEVGRQLQLSSAVTPYLFLYRKYEVVSVRLKCLLRHTKGATLFPHSVYRFELRTCLYGDIVASLSWLSAFVLNRTIAKL